MRSTSACSLVLREVFFKPFCFIDFAFFFFLLLSSSTGFPCRPVSSQNRKKESPVKERKEGRKRVKKTKRKEQGKHEIYVTVPKPRERHGQSYIILYLAATYNKQL